MFLKDVLRKPQFGLAAVALTFGFATASCTEETPPAEEPVQTDTVDQPAIPEPTPPVESFAPQTVYFAFDDYTLSMDAQNRLQELSNHLKSSQTAVVQIEGHCDERGSIEYNLALGERRANSVKNYLSQLGVDASRLSTISYGEEKPASDGHDEAAWSQNRRAEFTLSNQ